MMIVANATIQDFVADPTIELLAIKLYEHDCQSGRYPATMNSWANICPEDRQIYRDMAMGKRPLNDIWNREA
jgi:hypothetical protein